MWSKKHTSKNYFSDSLCLISDCTKSFSTIILTYKRNDRVFFLSLSDVLKSELRGSWFSCDFLLTQSCRAPLYQCFEVRATTAAEPETQICAANNSWYLDPANYFWFMVQPQGWKEVCIRSLHLLLSYKHYYFLGVSFLNCLTLQTFHLSVGNV